jgi:putative transposase
LSYRRRKISEYVVDETLIKVGSESIWLWVAIELENKQVLALFGKYPKKETCLLLRDSLMIWSRYMVYTVYRQMEEHDPKACQFLRLEHHLQFSL